MYESRAARPALSTLEETFWASRFGTLVERYAISWMINCEKAED